MYARMDSTVLRVMEVVSGTDIILPPYISLTGLYHIEFIGGGRIYKKLSRVTRAREAVTRDSQWTWGLSHPLGVALENYIFGAQVWYMRYGIR